MLVISSSCFAHFLKRRRPLLLHFPTPSVPITPSRGLVICAHSGIEVPEEDEFVCLGCCRNPDHHRSLTSSELVTVGA